jgi:hypothetical protein
MPANTTAAAVLCLTAFCYFLRVSHGAERPIDGIADNSFLVEEAYNQEEGVIQHIFSAYYSADSRTRGWTFNFTQEWPVFSQTHQFSFTIPSYHLRDEGQRVSGVGDILLNYRYQALNEEDHGIAGAPRFSLIVPTGNRRSGTGNGVVGYQFNLPFSRKMTDRIATHVNMGLSYQPKVRTPLDSPGKPLSPHKSLLDYSLGASAIYAVTSRFNLMLEWVGISEQSLDGLGKRSRAFSSILSPGVRGAVINEKELQSVIGFAVPIGLNRNTDTFGAFLYLSIEHKLF